MAHEYVRWRLRSDSPTKAEQAADQRPEDLCSPYDNAGDPQVFESCLDWWANAYGSGDRPC